VIINNAAVLGPVGNLRWSNASAWSDCLDVNVKGVAFMTAAFREQLEHSDTGRVVNLSGGGVGGPTPMLRVSAYVASKYAIAGLTEVLASEFAESSVTVNAIAPGALPTTFMDGVVHAGPEIAGTELFADASSRSGAVTSADLSPFLRLLDFLISTKSSHISGRLLSARWDSPELLLAHSSGNIDDNLFRVRRIDDALFTKLLQ
jgi:NAD(P)-dependent dehydrogenase (short-subunit alcohol dehydrogenase family)